MFTLKEHLTFDQAKIVTEAVDNGKGGKNLFMEGIFVQGNKQNQNQRIYPVKEITKAVNTVQGKIDEGFTVLGEADHPDDLQVNLDRVSHMIERMWMQGNDGYGRLKLLPTPMGNICITLLENGVKLGVSSRGSGNVTESGNVFIQLIYLGIVTIFVNLIADISYAFMSSYFFQTSSIKTKKLINTISGICLVLIGIYLFFSRFL